jgi:hypothetical protein
MRRLTISILSFGFGLGACGDGSQNQGSTSSPDPSTNATTPADDSGEAGTAATTAGATSSTTSGADSGGTAASDDGSSSTTGSSDPGLDTPRPTVYKVDPDGSHFIWNPEDPEQPVMGNLALNGSSLMEVRDGVWQHYGDSGVRIYAYPDSWTHAEGDEERETFVNEYCGELGTVKERGYWVADDDFQNYENRFRGKLVEGPADDGSLTFTMHSMSHDEEVCNGMGGSSNHLTVELETRALGLQKEMYHVDYSEQVLFAEGDIDISAETVDVSLVSYNIDSDDGTELWRKFEVYLAQGETFEKIGEFVDRNDWGSAMDANDSSFRPGEAVTWGSPLAIFKCNDKEFEIEYWDIYSISMPPQPL